ncbi:MAG: DUF202 domain-containing protein [Gammaproteobacteria bacterium]|jgi:putative membrane protein
MPDNSPELEQLTNAHRLVYFAAERTLLSWVRAALGLMALGFVIDRFGLVLGQQIPAMNHLHINNAYSFWGGSLMVLVGALMALAATIRYWIFAYEYRRREETKPGHGLFMGVVFSFVIALLGFVVAAYLLNIK